jgi:hypothetical protein
MLVRCGNPWSTRKFFYNFINIASFCLACFVSPTAAHAQDVSRLDCHEHFNAFMPTLVLKYEVVYRLFWMDIMDLAKAVVYATDGEWINEATGEWTRAYLLVFQLDTLEEPSEIGRGRYSIHNRLGTVLVKPSLEPLLFVKRDFMHVDTFLSSVDVHNAEYFSVESGKFSYIKKDEIAKTTTTNMPYFAQIASQRSEVLRFMKTVAARYAGNTSNFAVTNNFNISIVTDNTFVPFTVDIYPSLKTLDALDKDYKTIYFKAGPQPGYHGKGRNLAAWIAPFRYMAEMSGDLDMVWMAKRSFDLGMIPLRAEFGLQLGTVRCSLVGMSLEPDFETDL